MKSRNCILAFTLLMVMSIPTMVLAHDAGTPVKQAHHHHYKFIDLGTFW